MTADFAVNSVSAFDYFMTVLKRIMETASFTIPSPKTKLKSLGYSLGLISDTAAITSDEQRREHISRISMVSNDNVVSIQTPYAESKVYCLRP